MKRDCQGEVNDMRDEDCLDFRLKLLNGQVKGTDIYTK